LFTNGGLIAEDLDMYLLVVDFFSEDYDADDQSIGPDQAEIGHAETAC
jgi:hypothetical protein